MRKPAVRMPVNSRVARCSGGVLPSCVIVLWLGFASIATHAAQRSTPVSDAESPTRLLTSAEGRSIVDIAWQQDLPARGTQDCSHLVHQIYFSAGFEYPYASSNDIYAGNENFARVKYPHAGDLIAWPGHVGIVVDPARHSFFSLVRSGLGEQDYTAPYWRSRGVARFYRFRVSRSREMMAANTASVSNETGKSSRTFVGPIAAQRAAVYDQSSDRPPVAASARNAKNRSLQVDSARARTAEPAVTDDEERATVTYSDSDRPPAANSRRGASVYGPPTPHDDAATESNPAPVAVPKNVIISTASAIPTREEAVRSISDWAGTFGNSVRDEDPFKSAVPVVIVEQFSVEKIEAKHNKGWARVAVDSRLAIEAGATQAKRRHEKTRWELRLTDSGWEATPPQDRIYLPHDVAVKNLAALLAQIAASDGATQHQQALLQQEAQLAALLNALLQKK